MCKKRYGEKMEGDHFPEYSRCSRFFLATKVHAMPAANKANAKIKLISWTISLLIPGGSTSAIVMSYWNTFDAPSSSIAVIVTVYMPGVL